MTYKRRFTITRHVVCANCVCPRLVLARALCQVYNFFAHVTIFPLVTCCFVFEIQDVCRCVIFLVNFAIFRFLGFVPSNRRHGSRIVRFKRTFTFDKLSRRYTIRKRKRNEDVVTMIRRTFNGVVFTSANFFMCLTAFRGRLISRGTINSPMCGTVHVFRTDDRVIYVRGNYLNYRYRSFNARRASVTMNSERGANATGQYNKCFIL